MESFFSFNLFGLEFELGAEVIAAGASVNFDNGNFSFKFADVIGFFFSVNW